MNRTESKPFTVAYIPAYNEERTIGSVVVRAMRFVDRVVVCDDGSPDPGSVVAVGLLAFSASLHMWVGASKVVLRSGGRI